MEPVPSVFFTDVRKASLIRSTANAMWTALAPGSGCRKHPGQTHSRLWSGVHGHRTDTGHPLRGVSGMSGPDRPSKKRTFNGHFRSYGRTFCNQDRTFVSKDTICRTI